MVLPSDKSVYKTNLVILGKIQRGDMLAAAGPDGKFTRKTNWLTKATSSDKTHDEKLFQQIEDVLRVSEFDIDGDPDGQKELIQQYIQANKGLEILLSTYRSKGSKETKLIDGLTLLLAEHAVNFESQNSKNQNANSNELKSLAKEAINYVNDCRIRSVNNIHKGGWGNPYFGEKYDGVLFSLLVRGASNVRTGKNTAKELKTYVAAIVRMPISRKQKKEELAKILNAMAYSKEELGLDHLTSKHDGKIRSGHKFITNYEPFKTSSEEAQRIKIARRAIRTRLGNCYDKAAVAATYLIEKTKGNVGICRVAGAPRYHGDTHYDHAWVLISEDKHRLVKAIDTIESRRGGDEDCKRLFPKDTWVVDGWTRDWWQLRSWFNSACNVRQIGVRHKIRAAIRQGKIRLNEIVNWPPQPDYRWFSLKFAHLTNLDFSLISHTDDLDFTKFRKAMEVVKACRSELAQILSPILIKEVIEQEDPSEFLACESMVGRESSHNSARPISEKILGVPSPRVSGNKAAHNSLALRDSVKSTV
jgi:hypothetical protein